MVRGLGTLALEGKEERGYLAQGRKMGQSEGRIGVKPVGARKWPLVTLSALASCPDGSAAPPAAPGGCRGPAQAGGGLGDSDLPVSGRAKARGLRGGASSA